MRQDKTIHYLQDETRCYDMIQYNTLHYKTRQDEMIDQHNLLLLTPSVSQYTAAYSSSKC
eukprot:11521624-Ditylum_brightwellii.AAC.1